MRRIVLFVTLFILLACLYIWGWSSFGWLPCFLPIPLWVEMLSSLLCSLYQNTYISTSSGDGTRSSSQSPERYKAYTAAPGGLRNQFHLMLGGPILFSQCLAWRKIESEKYHGKKVKFPSYTECR